MTVENYYAPTPYSSGLPIIEEFRMMAEERLGFPITFEFITYGWDSYMEQKELMLAAGTDLPWFIWNVQDHQKWGEAGVLIDMLPLIEQYAPNMQKELEERPILKAVPSTPDGKMYGYAMVSPPQYINGGGVVVRQDWLDKFGLSVPTTATEWLNVVRTFHTRDANGDGKQNELVTVSANRQHLTMGAWFGLQTWRSGGFQVNRDGAVEYAWIQPRAKEYVEMVRDLYTEGILDPDFTNMNRERFAARMNSDLVGSVITYAGTASAYTETYPIPGASYTDLPVLIGPHGDQFMELSAGVDIPTSITRDADPKTAIIIYDTARSPEGGVNNLYGIKGLTYEINDGVYELTDLINNHPDGIAAGQAMNALGGRRNFLRGHSYVSWEQQWSVPAMKAARDARPYHRIDIPFTEGLQIDLADLATVDRYLPDILTYVDENIIKFMIGEQSMEKWDEYVQTVNKLGIDRVIAVRQKQADRFIGIVGDDYPWR
jgi:putative aldouronate transport system substrate-binding protein